MNIVIVNNSVLPALNYGGVQRVTWYLAKELNKRGHKVTFLSAKGSKCPFADIIEFNPLASIQSQLPLNTDIVHINDKLTEKLTTPYVVTIHGNIKSGDIDRNSIFVSRNHANRSGCDSFVYNGMDWESYGEVDLSRTRKGYHFLGKAAWRVKNIKGAISTVKHLKGETLEVLGGYRFNLKMGMRFTFNPRIHFWGMVGDEKKREVIEHSKGLIFPVKWNEPFGLAITESLYFGSPVFGTPYGSLPELVSSEVGFLTNNEAELIGHLSDCSYSPKICHEYARDKFNSSVMAEEYIKKYEEVLNGNQLIKEIKTELIPKNMQFTWE